MSIATRITAGFQAVGTDIKAILTRVSTAETKLSGIEVGATADQTATEIATLYEGISSVNRYTTTEKTKLTGIEAGATADQTAAEIVSLYEGTSGVNRYTTADKTKVGHLTVTTATNLDDIRNTVAGLGNVMSLKGTWNAATAFPSSGAKVGDTWIVSAAGTKSSPLGKFEVNDRLICVGLPVSTTAVTNWFKADYSDEVQSVNGQTGDIVGLQVASEIGDTDRNFLADYTTSRDA